MRNEEGHFTKIEKESIHQEAIRILHVYANGANDSFKVLKHGTKLDRTVRSRQICNYNQRFQYPSIKNQENKHSIGKDIKELDNTISQLGLAVICGTFHQTTDYTCFLSAQSIYQDEELGLGGSVVAGERGKEEEGEEKGERDREKERGFS
jgi:hypothetical protein